MTESIELLVVENYNLFGEEVYKCDSEIQAFRKYKELKGCKKNIFSRWRCSNIKNWEFRKDTY